MLERADEKKSEVIIKYYLPDHEHLVWLHFNAQKMYSILWEVVDKCTFLLSYSEKALGGRRELAEEIKDLILEKINLNEVP
jgi:hypothetical protein